MVEEFTRNVNGRTSRIAGRDRISVMSKESDEREDLRHGSRNRKKKRKVKREATCNFIISLNFGGRRESTNRHSEK